MATVEIVTQEEKKQENVSLSLSQKYTGVVKWFDSRGGFGFITVLGENDQSDKEIFVHYSALSTTLTGQYKYLVLGEYVEFALAKAENEKYEFYAKDVTGIWGGNLMCQSRKLFESGRQVGKSVDGKGEEEGEEEKQRHGEPKNEVQSRESRFRKRPAAPKYVYKKPRVSEKPKATQTHPDTDGYKLVGKGGKY